MSKVNESRQVIVKSLSTHKSIQETLDFFNNVKNMELGRAIHSVQKNSDGWYTSISRRKSWSSSGESLSVIARSIY